MYIERLYISPETVLENIKTIRNRESLIHILTQNHSFGRSVLKGVCTAGVLNRFAINLTKHTANRTKFAADILFDLGHLLIRYI